MQQWLSAPPEKNKKSLSWVQITTGNRCVVFHTVQESEKLYISVNQQRDQPGSEMFYFLFYKRQGTVLFQHQNYSLAKLLQIIEYSTQKINHGCKCIIQPKQHIQYLSAVCAY